jgi:hypothetical protein
MALEVELLSRVQFLRASRHYLAVARDRVRLVKVVYSVDQRSLVEFALCLVKLES